MTVEIVPLSAEHEPAYASFVGAHPDALISYTLSYRDMLVDTLGCQPRYVVALRDNVVVGAMPLMSLASRLGTVLNSLPYFGSSGGPLAADTTARDALCSWYDHQVMDQEVVAATLIANPLAAEDPNVAHDLVDWRVAHVTHLAGDGDAERRVWEAIDGSARRNVAKARRCGTDVNIENDSFIELEALHRSSMRAIGARTKDHEFFAAVLRHFRPGLDFNLYIARIDHAAVAALLVFYCATTVDYYVPAVSPDHRGEQPMAAILLRAMTDAASTDLARWNWGGSWPSHETLQRFKAKWGGAPRRYEYRTKLNDPDLLRARETEILDAYPGFFVVPFSYLAQAR